MKKEILIEKYDEIALNVSDGKINSYREKEETKNTVRVYENGSIGVAGALGEVDLTELEKQAVKKLGDGIPYVCNLSKGVKREVMRRPATDKSAVLRTGKRVALKAAKVCPRFLITGKIKYTESSGKYMNSENTELAYSNSGFSVSFVIKDRDSSNIMDAAYGSMVGRYGKSVEDKIVEDMKVLHENYFAEKVKLPDGEYPVILESYDILGHLLQSLVAEVYVSGGSILSGKLGEKVFSDKLSLYVDRNPSTNHSDGFYDSEGEFATDYRPVLIKDGVLKNVFDSKNTAAMFNLPLSKTAHSAYDGVPSIGIPGIIVKSTAPDLKTLLGDQEAIYISISSGGDMTTEGVVGMPVMLAFLVKGGKIVGRVSEFNASGNIFDILGKNFIGVSKENLFKASESEMLVTKMNIYNN